jgi:hypothetical protein
VFVQSLLERICAHQPFHQRAKEGKRAAIIPWESWHQQMRSTCHMMQLNNLDHGDHLDSSVGAIQI